MSILSVVRSNDPHSLQESKPPLVEPGSAPGQPPGDAIILFGGTDLDAFRPGKALWSIRDGLLDAEGQTLPIKTKERFSDIQLHIEWMVDPILPGFGGKKNDDTRIAFSERWNLRFPTGKGKLDSLIGEIGRPDGYPPPLFNANRKAGEWQTYDVIFEAPRYEDETDQVRPARLTAHVNGVMIYHNQQLPMHGIDKILDPSRRNFTAPLALYDDSHCVRFKNFWVRRF